MIYRRILANVLPFLAIVLIASVVSLWFGVYGFAAGDDQPCAANPETRKLDFWIGNWTIGNGAEQTISKVSLALDKCEFVERWENGKGHATEKTFAYSPDDKSWYGMFADNQGRAHIFVDGKVSADSAEFHGPSRGPNGEAVLNRLKITRVSADAIQEAWEKSTDNGSHWTTAYTADYSRAKP
jgi:hypothetical protein